MSAVLRAVAPGPHVTVQDAGRRGWRRFGVSTSGAMDWPALAIANALVGNPPDTAALEFAQVGGIWEVAAGEVAAGEVAAGKIAARETAAVSCRIAVTGGAFAVSADGIALAPWQSHTLRHGQRLSLRAAPDAVWGYLAVAQGFDLVPQLGSCSTHLRSGLGGITGRRIAEGDALILRATLAPAGRERRIAAPHRVSGPVRVVLGPQDDYFTPETIAAFLAATWRVSHRGDRMGTWLDGPTIVHANGYNVVSDGLVPGCIQVPGTGQPVVLLMDCQTIGGFPKPATVITADLPRFAQCRPGSQVRFTAIGIDAAQSLYRASRATIAGLGQAIAEVADPAARPFWLRR